MKFFRIIILISFFCKTIVLQAQGNLVPNGNFEEYSHCPNFSLGETTYSVLSNWYNPNQGSPDYRNQDFTNCSCAFCGCEYCGNMNGSGYQVASSGNGYLGIYCLDYRFSGTGYSGIDYRNMSENNGVKLSKKLLLGKKYKVSLYLSLSNKSYYAINKFGFYFSNAPVYSSSAGQRINVVPQVAAPNKFYSDTVNWEKIEGEFIAQGGEEYLTIGNFWQIDDVDTLCVNASSTDKHRSYYYIDDVSVVCLDCFVGIKEQEQTRKVSYNNSTNSLNVSERGNLVIYNMQGAKVWESLVNSQQVVSLNAEDLGGAGVYVWQFQTNEDVTRGKFVIAE